MIQQFIQFFLRLFRRPAQRLPWLPSLEPELIPEQPKLRLVRRPTIESRIVPLPSEASISVFRMGYQPLVNDLRMYHEVSEDGTIIRQITDLDDSFFVDLNRRAAKEGILQIWFHDDDGLYYFTGHSTSLKGVTWQTFIACFRCADSDYMNRVVERI